MTLLRQAADNHQWRQKGAAINLIPSENTPSRAVRLLSASDPAFRYAEHKKILSFYDKDVFYYQGTKFIDRVEQLLAEEMKAYLGCQEVETRVISGQMSNMAVFSSLMDWKNRFDPQERGQAPGLCDEQPHHQGRPPLRPAHGRPARLHRHRPGDGKSPPW